MRERETDGQRCSQALVVNLQPLLPEPHHINFHRDVHFYCFQADYVPPDPLPRYILEKLEHRYCAKSSQTLLLFIRFSGFEIWFSSALESAWSDMNGWANVSEERSFSVFDDPHVGSAQRFAQPGDALYATA